MDSGLRRNDVTSNLFRVALTPIFMRPCYKSTMPCSFLRAAVLPTQTSRKLLALLLCLAASSASAARVNVTVEGVSPELQTVILGAVELQQYASREVSRAQVQRLYRRAERQVRYALEPYGYYNPTFTSKLDQDGETYTARLQVDAGPAVTITRLDLEIEGLPTDDHAMRSVRAARSAFAPGQGQPLDHALYERSKAAIHAALIGVGFLDAKLETHRVEVERASNSAHITLLWKAGHRHRFAETGFEGGQFPSAFMQRFIPWNVGDYYSQDKLLELQQRLVDTGYFSISQVQPDIEHAADDNVPIAVMLAPAKRTVYTGGLFVGTDTGFGLRGGVERRWVNKRGHKLRFESIVAQRLKTLSSLYQIPLPGQDNHSFNFGVTYRDENTDTSESQTFRLAANDSRTWHGWTRTVGLQFLTGDFTVAQQKGNTTLLYPEISLSKKHADDFNFPRKGWSMTLVGRAAQEGVLADTSFAQIGADAKWIHGLGEHGRFIARGSAGITQVGGFDKLPPELRFFAGGDRSIRGYSFQSVGPRIAVEGEATPQVIGGERLLVGSAEYEHYFSPKWGAAAFVDAGDAFSGKDFDLKIGAGLGLRWRSPVGMVRVDLGTPISDTFASGVELHIIIGPDL
jgi:translocation and assembly module TamA